MASWLLSPFDMEIGASVKPGCVSLVQLFGLKGQARAVLNNLSHEIVIRGGPADEPNRGECIAERLLQDSGL